jgi:hypothetical protein
VSLGLTGTKCFLNGVQGVLGRIRGFLRDIRHFERRLVVTPDCCGPNRHLARAAPRARELSEPAGAKSASYRRRAILSAWHYERNRAEQDFFIIVNFLLTMAFSHPNRRGYSAH